MHVLIKRSAEFVLARSGLLRVARTRHRSGTLVLAYHNIVPTGERAAGDSSLHLAQRDFAEQLDILVDTHDVVALPQILSTGSGGTRPRAVITFDDAYQGALTAGVEELRRRRLPATIFVAPAFVGGGTFWWDVLAASHHGALPAGVRRHAIEKLAGNDRLVRAWAHTKGLPAVMLPEHQRCASEAQLGEAGAGGMIALASHSWSHPDLSRLSQSELAYELTASREWLQQRFTHAIPWVSYPYGNHSEAVRKESQRAGYCGGFAIDGGWITPSEDAPRYALARCNVPAGISHTGFTILASGVV